MLLDSGRIAKHFESLEDNWNSYDATKPTEASLTLIKGAKPTEASLNLIKGMNILPTYEGGVVLVVHANGYDIEIEFDSCGGLKATYCSKVL